MSGDVEIRVLRYETNEGTQTQKSLKKSWSKTVNVDSGTDVKMSATVRLFGGETKISFTGRDSSGTRVMGEQDLCSMN